MPVAVPEMADRCVVAQRRGQDLRDDRVAGGLDDRARRRRQGRDEPAVAPDLERLQRRPARRARGGHRALSTPSPRCARPSTGAGARSSSCSGRSTGSRARRRRARSTSTRRSRACSARSCAASARRPASSWPSSILEHAEVAVVPGRGVRHPGLLPAVLRAGRRRPARGRRADGRAARRGPLTDAAIIDVRHGLPGRRRPDEGDLGEPSADPPRVPDVPGSPLGPRRAAARACAALRRAQAGPLARDARGPSTPGSAYVALGDSYTASPLTGPCRARRRGACESPTNYPYLVADRHQRRG